MRGFRAPLVIAMLFGVLWTVGSGAQAQDYPPQTPTPTVIASRSPSPPPPSISPPPSTPPSVEPSRGPEPSSPPPEVPFTGADLTRFVLIGAGLTLAGTAVVRLTRKLGDDRS